MKASGSLTVVDLLDTATYIYYSNNKNGIDASFSPREDSEYIGIYNGPALSNGRPLIPPKGTEWFKYKGDKGVGVKSTLIEYQISDSQTSQPITGWQEQIPQATAEKPFLWTQTTINYTNDTVSRSYNVSRAYVENKNNSFLIKTNQEEILKFQTEKVYEQLGNGKQRVKNLTFSPDPLTFEIFKKEAGQEQKITNFYYQVFLNNIDISSFCRKIEGGRISLSLVELAAWEEDSLIKEVTLRDQIRELLSKDFPNTFLIRIRENESLDSTVIAQKVVLCRYGLSSEGAQLNIYAAGISAAIQNTKMNFDANGLHIKNGGFDITNDQSQKVFFIDPNGNLNITGIINANSGVFRGRLEATEGFFKGNITGASGIFSGTLKANSGEIGGFTIKEGYLSSTENVKVGGVPSIVLDGKNGILTAENIVLGKGAKIREYIQLGDNVYLKNTIYEKDSFLTVSHDIDGKKKTVLSLNGDGTIVAGDDSNHIYIDGQKGTIYSRHYMTNADSGEQTDFNQGWKLANDHSFLNDVTIKGSIKASVMEYGKVQAVGGILMIRPSSQISSIEYVEGQCIVTIEENSAFEGGYHSFNEGDWCQVTDGNQTVYLEILQVNKKSLTVSENLTQEVKGNPIVNLGKNGSVGIGINATENDFSLTPQSISVFEFYNKDSVKKLIPRIILGRLPSDTSFGAAGGKYGLYAENVLLKGSLVTQSSVESGKKFSGISTVYDTDAPTSKAQFDLIAQSSGVDFTPGEILLWAGAENTTPKGIEESKFFVDRNGNLLAKSGYFKGTIITDAKISASEIETAVITGSNAKESEPALTIKDTNKGILFTDLNNREVLKVSNKNCSINTISIQLNKGCVISDKGKILSDSIYIYNTGELNNYQSGVVFCSGKRIGFIKELNASNLAGTPTSYIDFNNGVSFSGDGKTKQVICTAEKISIEAPIAFSSDITYSENMQYKRVYENNQLIGYDLYLDL